MAEANDRNIDEKTSPAQHLEAVNLEEGKKNDGPVYGIDETHQKRVMCGFRSSCGCEQS